LHGSNRVEGEMVGVGGRKVGGGFWPATLT
jgi:hypothetical protein